MTDDIEARRRAVSTVLTGVVKKTALITAVAAAALIVLSVLRGEGQRWWFLPVSVLFGALLGIANFRWLAIAVERVYLRQGATPGLSNLAAVIISILKLSLIFVILFIVIKWQLVHIFGLVGGLSLCFLAIIWEGVTLMKQTVQNRGQ